MKKILIFIQLIALIILCSSCNDSNNHTNSDNTIDEHLESATESQRIELTDPAPVNTESNISDAVQGEVYLLTNENYEEYKKFIESTKLPENFVYYDDISAMGSFDGFVCLSDYQRNDYSSLFYTLINERNVKFSLYINIIDGKEDKLEASLQSYILSNEDINRNDMRRISTSETRAHYEHNGIKYKYINGDLLSITWQEGVTEYIISLSTDDLEAVGVMDSSTFLGKLLRVDSSDVAVKSLTMESQK